MIEASQVGDYMKGLIERSHSMAVSKGWWPTQHDGTADFSARPWCEQFNNYISEISEAWEEFRARRVDTWFQESGKPEGYWVELGDLLIRIADSLGAYNDSSAASTAYSVAQSAVPQGIPEFVSRLIYVTSLMCDRLKLNICRQVFDMCFEHARISGVDLADIIEKKAQYNQTRPFRHGGKLA